MAFIPSALDPSGDAVLVPGDSAFVLPVVAAAPTAPYALAGIATSDPAYQGVIAAPSAGGHVLTVGAGGQYGSLSAAVAAAENGDVIAIAAGSVLTNDFADITKSITIEAVGGMATLLATQAPPNEKGILVVDGATVTIKNLSFSGAAVSDADGGNGAGIRYDSGSLTLVNCDFNNNQNGILANADPSGSISISHCSFENNGSGSGYTHDIYIGEIANFSITDSVIASANVGHEIKSRADNSVISNNIIMDGPTGTGSYDIDLPDGGNASITGNYIEKGPNAQNQTMVSVGEEGIPYNNSSLLLQGNLLVNDRQNGAIGLKNDTLVPAIVTGNSFVNVASGNLVQGAATLTDNSADGVAVADSAQATLTSGPGVTLFTDAAPHSLTLGSDDLAVQGGGGLLSIAAYAGHETVIGGTGGLDYSDDGALADASGDVITTVAGAVDSISILGQDSINSNGRDSIQLGPGNATVAVGGQASLSGGTGSNSITVAANASLALVIPSGSDWLSVAPLASASVTGQPDYLQAEVTNAHLDFALQQAGQAIQASIDGGGSVTVSGGSADIILASGDIANRVSLGVGSFSVQSSGADLITAGSGAESFILSGAATVYGGSGALTVYGYSNSAASTVYAGSGPIDIDGADGLVRYVGNGLATTVTVNLSHSEIDGGSGLLTIGGTPSDCVITGGSGGIDLENAIGGDVITTAPGSRNLITLVGASTILSQGTDVIQCGSGNLSLTATGTASITGSQGSSVYNLDGHDSLTSVGNDIVTIGAAATVTLTADGPWMTVNDDGGSLTLSEVANGDQVGASISGTATVSVVGGSGGLAVALARGAAPAIVQLAGGNDQVQSFGADQITTGAGNDLIIASGLGDVIEIAPQQTASSVHIENFTPGVDQLRFDLFGGAVTLTALLAGATQAADGWIDLHPSAQQDVELVGLPLDHATLASLAPFALTRDRIP